MPKTWIEESMIIGASIKDAAERHPELEPLYTSWVNFIRKHSKRNSKSLTGRTFERSKTGTFTRLQLGFPGVVA